MKTTHQIFYRDARDLKEIPSESVDLVVTSPPYPMIGMWDDIFGSQNLEIEKVLKTGDGKLAHELMHKILDSVWDEVFRVLKDGRFACINIGDATRKVNGDFCLYPNHARILNYLLNIGFSALPDILWRKQTNAPNKFMGSGMLPAGAYVTLEHEYILILHELRALKGSLRRNAKNRTGARALCFGRRGISGIRMFGWILRVQGRGFLLGTGLKTCPYSSRLRSAAFPYDLAYRLINMYSVKGDMILDPFLGTGTTMAAAMTSGRNSIGVEIDESFHSAICPMAATDCRFFKRLFAR